MAVGRKMHGVTQAYLNETRYRRLVAMPLKKLLPPLMPLKKLAVGHLRGGFAEYAVVPSASYVDLRLDIF